MRGKCCVARQFYDKQITSCKEHLLLALPALNSSAQQQWCASVTHHAILQTIILWMQAAAEAQAQDAKQSHEQQLQQAEAAHLHEMGELRARVMELSAKDSHTAAELAEMDALRSRVIDLQASIFTVFHFAPQYPVTQYSKLSL